MFDNIEINCPCCQKSFNYYFKNFVVDTNVNEEREMGEETEYTIKCEDYKCPYCSKSLSIVGSIWEYPAGALNDTDLQIIPTSNNLEVK